MNLKLELANEDDGVRLVLKTDLLDGTKAALQVVRNSRGRGWLWHDDKLFPWEIRAGGGKTEIAVSGSWSCGGGTLVSLEWHQALEQWGVAAVVLGLVGLLKAVQQNSQQVPDFGPFSVIPFRFDQRPGWLLLPSPLATTLVAVTPSFHLARQRAWIHPDLKGDLSWSFVLSALVLVARVGILPWQTDDESLEHEEIRRLGPEKAARWLAGYKPDLQNLVARSWAGSASLGDWKNILADHEVQNQLSQPPKFLPDSERRRIKHHHQRAKFWQRHSGRILIAGIGILIVLLVGGGVLWQFLKPWPEDSWSPAEVVAGYYQAWNTMNVQTLGHLAADDRATAVLGLDKTQTTSEFVLRQVRTAYEHLDPFESPSVWLKAGRPALKPGYFVRGVIHLRVSQVGPRVWKATYDRWISVPNDRPGHQNENLAALVLGSHDTDLLDLVKTAHGWKVASIVRKESPLVP